MGKARRGKENDERTERTNDTHIDELHSIGMIERLESISGREMSWDMICQGDGHALKLHVTRLASDRFTRSLTAAAAWFA